MRREDNANFLVAFILAGICLFGNLNTRIGWPWNCVNQDTTVLAAFVMAWLSFGLALVMMAWSARTGRPCCLWLVLALLVGTVGILQWLPRSSTGIQILACSPWAFDGWIPFLLSLLSWFFAAIVFLALTALDRAKVFPVFLLIFLAVSAPLSFWNFGLVEEAARSSQVTTAEMVDGHRARIIELRSKRDEAQRILEVLHRDRDMLVERLRRLGVRSSADLKDIPEARPLVEELVEIVGQIQEQEKTVRRLDLAVIEGESILRRVERQEVLGKVGFAEKDEHLVRGRLEMKESLPIKDDVSILKADDVVDEVLGK